MEIKPSDEKNLHIRVVDKAAEVAGVQLIAKKGATDEEKIEQVRKALQSCWPLRVEVPCGCSMGILSPEDFPVVDTRCDCGKHWFVRWTE